MNRKGDSILMGIVVGIFLFMIGMLSIGFIDDVVKDTQNVTINDQDGLNCGTSSNPNLSISDGAKATCLITEAVVPYFIILIISAAGGMMVARFLL